MFNTLAVLSYLATHQHPQSVHMHLYATLSKQETLLQWDDAPPGTQAIALLIKARNHYKPRYFGVFYNLSPEAHQVQLKNNLTINQKNIGQNSWGQHLMRFDGSPAIATVYALDKRLSAQKNMTGEKLLQKIKGHVIAKTRRLLKWRRQ